MPQLNSVFGLVARDLNQRKYSSAMMRLTILSNIYSKDLVYLGLMAQTQKAMGDFNALIKTLSVIAQISPSNAANLDLMYCLYTQGRLNESLDVALELQEKVLTDIQEKSLVHCLLRIYLEFSDYEGVEEVALRYKNFQNDAMLLWSQGLAKLAAGNKNQALDLFRQTVEINPNHDQAWVSLALLHEEMGDRELALANLERALDVNSNNAIGLKLMSKWHSRQNEQIQNVMDKVRYYLAEHEFDEEISLCYAQLLKENSNQDAAEFEINKLILNYPSKKEYYEMKKNLEVNGNI